MLQAWQQKKSRAVGPELSCPRSVLRLASIWLVLGACVLGAQLPRWYSGNGKEERDRSGLACGSVRHLLLMQTVNREVINQANCRVGDTVSQYAGNHGANSCLQYLLRVSAFTTQSCVQPALWSCVS